MSWARLEPFAMPWDAEERPTVMEVIDWDPAGRYAPEIVWRECPDGTKQYQVLDEATGVYADNPMPDGWGEETESGEEGV